MAGILIPFVLFQVVPLARVTSRNNANPALRFLKTGVMKYRHEVMQTVRLLGGIYTFKRIFGKFGPNILPKCSNHQPFSCDTFSSKNAEAIKCSDKYHIWQSKSVVARYD